MSVNHFPNQTVSPKSPRPWDAERLERLKRSQKHMEALIPAMIENLRRNAKEAEEAKRKAAESPPPGPVAEG